MRLEEFGKAEMAFARGRPVLERYLPPVALEAVANELEQRRGSASPEVMVYGVYNAGKSTLINALFGREEAKIGDVPTTDKVDVYQWQGFRLHDTPGIDAPIEHEEVTQEKLDRADVVIFVISTDGVAAEGKTYQVAAKLLHSRRQVMLVLNNKSALEPDSVELIAIRDQMRKSLQQAADDLGLGSVEQVPIFVVNALSGLRAKLEDKASLLQHSGLPLLEQRLGEFLAQTDEADVARSLRRQVRALVEEGLQVAEERTARYGLKEHEEFRSFLAKERARIHTELTSTIDDAERALRSRARELLEVSAGSGSLRSEVEALSAHYSGQLEDELKAGLEQFRQHVDEFAAKLRPEEVHIKVDANLEAVAEDAVTDAERSGADLDLGPLFDLARGIKIPKLPKSLPIVEIVISVVQLLWGYYKEKQQLEAQERQARRRAQAIEDSAREFAAGWAAGARNAARKALEQSFGPIDAELAKRHRQLQGELREIADDCEVLRSLKHSLDESVEAAAA